MPFILNASACPSPPVASGVYDITAGPLTSPGFSDGDTTTIRPSLNQLGARVDLTGRYGGGVYGLCTGYTLSAGSGLTLNVAAGLAMIDGPVEKTSSQTASLTDSGRNWIWLSRAGALTVVFNSTTPPAGAYCLLGSALTSGGSISSVDQSGVVYLVGGTAFRRSADTVTPTDTPSSAIQFFHRGASKLWWWDGSAYWQVSPATNAFSQAIIQPSTSFTLSQVQTGATEIDLQSGGGVAATFDVTVPSAYAVASQCWVFHNTTGQPCRLTYQGGSAYVYMQSGQTTFAYFDGTELREAGRNGFRYGGATVTAPTLTYTAWEQVEYDVFAAGPSGGNAAVEWPTAGALGNKGRRQVIRNDDSGTLLLTARTAGGAATYDSVLLPGESRSFYINNSGGLEADNTRPYQRRVGVSMGSDATKTVVHPDFLAVVIEVTSSVSLTATRDFILPLADHHAWFVKNGTTGGQSLRVIGSSGAGVTIRNGKGAWVRSTGTDFVRADPFAITTASSEEVAATTTSTATVTNSTVEATILGTAIGSLTLPASLLQPGRTVRFQARGVFGSDAAAHTLNLKLKFGSTTIVSTGAQTPPNGLTNRYWEVDVLIACRTAGASGTVFAQGRFSFMPAATGSLTSWEMTNTAAVTVDTTASQAVDLTATYGAGVTASDTISGTNMTLEVLN